MGVVRALSEAESLGVLGEVGAGRLALVTTAGPYAVPMLFALEDRSLLLYSTPGRKLEALRAHPSGVSLEVDDVASRPDWRSVMVVGRFSEGTASADRLRAAFGASVHPYARVALAELDRPDTVLGRLSIEQISGRCMQP